MKPESRRRRTRYA